jgi:hypothetical protein
MIFSFFQNRIIAFPFYRIGNTLFFDLYKNAFQTHTTPIFSKCLCAKELNNQSYSREIKTRIRIAVLSDFIDTTGGECYNPARMTGMAEKASSAAMGWRDRVRAFLYGMMNYEFERHTVEMRANLDTLFMALTFGDMLGLPIIPPFYTLRILPYIVPNINTWKRRTLREREFSEDHDMDLHGI